MALFIMHLNLVIKCILLDITYVNHLNGFFFILLLVSILKNEEQVILWSFIWINIKKLL